MTESDAPPPRWVLGLALGQGVTVYALALAMGNGSWLLSTPTVSFPMWILALAAPVFVMLSIDAQNRRNVLRYTGYCCAALTVVGVYLGWQATPQSQFPVDTLILTAAITLGLACFKALMYLQQRAAGAPMTYRVLFRNSWRNFLTVALALAFTGGVSLVLTLWAALFAVIDIELFRDLFREPAFFVPATSLSFGAGVLIFRNLTGVIDSITRLLEGFMRVLLPLVVVLTLSFLVSLPFAGLNLLWQTGNGTSLILWLTAIVLFFVNAVYQTGDGAPAYPRALHGVIAVGVAALPALCALSCYGLALRVAQYGWTVERCAAALVWTLLTLFSLGYAFGVIRRRLNWTLTLASVNRNMGLVVLAAMLLVNTPLADFRRISLASQVARVEAGEMPWTDYDFFYARHHLARPGYLHMQGLLADLGDADPELARLIREPVRRARGIPHDTEAVWADMTYRPDGLALPPALRRTMEAAYVFDASNTSMIVQVDLTADGVHEYVLINRSGSHTYGYYFYLVGDRWRHGSLIMAPGQKPLADAADLATGTITTEAPEFSNLKIGDRVFLTR